MEISRYTVRALLCAALLLPLTGCPPNDEEKDPAKKAEQDRRFGGVMDNPQESPQFKAFIGKLRQAVSNRDYDMIVKLTTPNFGYDLNVNTEGPLLAIQYWNQNGLWPELERVLSMPFHKKDRFVVGPPEFAFQTEKRPYTGFRAGMIETSNGYRFAYFVSDQSYGSAGGAYESVPAPTPGPGAPDPNTYIGDTPPSDALPLPQSTPPMPDGPRVLANPQDLETMPRVPRPNSGPLTPAP